MPDARDLFPPEEIYLRCWDDAVLEQHGSPINSLYDKAFFDVLSAWAAAEPDGTTVDAFIVYWTAWGGDNRECA
jgi:hypothetical protein